MNETREEFLDFVCERLAILGEIRTLRMFGGYCLYCRDVPFALIARNVLYLKVDDETRADFERRRLEPFRPFADREKMSLSYYLAPPEFFEDEDAAVQWGRRALAAGTRAQAKKRKKR